MSKGLRSIPSVTVIAQSVSSKVRCLPPERSGAVISSAGRVLGRSALLVAKSGPAGALHLTAEAAFLFGGRRAYEAAALLMSCSNGVAAYHCATTGGSPVMLGSMTALSAAYGIGALRHPIARVTTRVSEVTQEKRSKLSGMLAKVTSEKIQQAVGGSAVLSRMPLFIMAMAAQNYATAGALTLLGISDALFGSFQKVWQRLAPEQKGALASITGSTILLAAGDNQSRFCTLDFYVGTAMFGARMYTLPAALMAFGDGTLYFSDATKDNPLLKNSIGALAVIWGIGAARYPIARFCTWASKTVEARNSKLSSKLGGIDADVIRGGVGLASFVTKWPLLGVAIVGHSITMAVVLSCWGASDFGIGNVQREWPKIAKLFSRKQQTN